MAELKTQAQSRGRQGTNMAADVQPTRLYLGQSRGLLKNHFPFISVAAIDAGKYSSCHVGLYTDAKMLPTKTDITDPLTA